MMVFKFFKGPLNESVFVDVKYSTFPWTDEVAECSGEDHSGWNCAFRQFSSYEKENLSLSSSSSSQSASSIPDASLEVRRGGREGSFSACYWAASSLCLSARLLPTALLNAFISVSGRVLYASSTTSLP